MDLFWNFSQFITGIMLYIENHFLLFLITLSFQIMFIAIVHFEPGIPVGMVAGIYYGFSVNLIGTLFSGDPGEINIIGLSFLLKQKVCQVLVKIATQVGMAEGAEKLKGFSFAEGKIRQVPPCSPPRP